MLLVDQLGLDDLVVSQRALLVGHLASLRGLLVVDDLGIHDLLLTGAVL
jgi:hypothetical protein